MPRRPRQHFPGAIYHVMSRGIEGRQIYGSAEDFDAFVSILAWVRRERPYVLYAYSLMPNHFHLLIKVQEVPLDQIMHQVLTRYAIRFNEESQRVGYLFQGRYKAILCQDNAYFLELLRYIHLNPIRAGLEQRLGEWPWSGLLEYLGLRDRGLVDTAFPLAMFGDYTGRAREAYKTFLAQGLAQQAGFCDPPKALRSEARAKPEAPVVQTPHDMDEIARAVAADSGVPLEVIRGPSRSRWIMPARRELIRRAMQAGFRQAQVAVYLNRAESVISRLAADNKASKARPGP